jgi:peptide/nickel transport system substrate-binding protein
MTDLFPWPGGVSRRTLLKGLAGAGAGAALLSTFGCESAVDASSQVKASGAPRRGGALTAGISQDLVPGSILTNSTFGITTVVGLVFDSLIRYPNDKVEPTARLATSWKPGADGRSLTLELRDDVTFHTGRPFTSKDVEFSLKTYADPLWTAQLRSTAAAITGYDTSQPHRVVLTFDHPLGNVFDLLDTAPILDSETVAQLRTGEKIIGTGPFRLTSWTPNAGLRFDRNPTYWVPERPFLDSVDVHVITDAKALLSALRSGQIDFANGLGALDIDNLVAAGGFSKIVLEGAEQQIYVGSNVTAKPLDDVRLRQAIAYAMDRDRVVDEVLRGAGYPINLPWPRYSPAFDAAANSTYTLDVAKASALVKEVGVVPTLPLTYQPTATLTAAAAIAQANLAAVGITVELDPVDPAQFVKLLIGQQFKGLWLTNHSWAQYTPSTLTVSAYPFNAHKNASRYVDDGYIANADAAWEIPDGSSRAAVAAYKKVSDDLLEAAFLAEIAVFFFQWAVSDKLQGASYTKRAEVQLTDAYLAT